LRETMTKIKSTTKLLVTSALAISLAGLPALAQDPNAASSGGWKRFPQNAPSSDGSGQIDPSQDQAPVIQAPPAPATQVPMAPANPRVVTIPAGTWISIRVNEPLSSDHNQPGDGFSGTLAQSVIVGGLVVAHRGQSVHGRVSEAKKAGRVSGVSQLGLEVFEMDLADGTQAQIITSLYQQQGNTSWGRDAAAIGTTTAAGAAIGAAVNGGVGAGVGAAAGVVASTLGVLFTRGYPTVVNPEKVVTFRLESPVRVDATNYAFQPPTAQDYGQTAVTRRPYPGPPPAYVRPAYGYAAPYYAYPYPYPYYWGPSVFIGVRGGFHRW
jgi:hypothetical protein